MGYYNIFNYKVNIWHLFDMDKSQPPTKIGKCEFNQQNGIDSLISHLSPILKSMLQKEQWNLGDRQYRDLSAHQIFANASLIQANILWLDFNKKVNIIEDIIAPKYAQLTILYLGDNNIHTLQCLPQLNAPLLSKIYLNNNKITSLRPLRKCTFDLLIEINLNGNYITDQDSLVQAHFPLIEKISLGYKRASQRINESAWFLKAQIKNQTQILSPKHKLHSFTRLIYYNNIKESILKRVHPKDLFKTFEN